MIFVAQDNQFFEALLDRRNFQIIVVSLNFDKHVFSASLQIRCAIALDIKCQLLHQYSQLAIKATNWCLMLVHNIIFNHSRFIWCQERCSSYCPLLVYALLFLDLLFTLYKLVCVSHVNHDLFNLRVTFLKRLKQSACEQLMLIV